jgi:hypothetical protein
MKEDARGAWVILKVGMGIEAGAMKDVVMQCNVM